MKPLVSLFLLLSACTTLAAAQPNVLIILADDLGYSDLGCYGSEIHTPNLDALAAGGLRFTQFYNGARCCPSRASLLTGLYPHQAGVGLMTSDKGAKFPGSGDEGDKSPGYRGRLNNQCVTLGEVLRPAGYHTFACGKWHVGDFDPTTRGFDAFYGFFGGYGVNSYDEKMLISLPPGGPAVKSSGPYFATDAITDHAIALLQGTRQQPHKPWLMYLAYQAPHFPLQAPATDIDKYIAVYEQGWDRIRAQRLERMKKSGLVAEDTKLTPRSRIPNLKIAKDHGSATANEANPAWDSLPPARQKDLARRMATFAAMVDRMDANIGRVMADLKQAGELENTLVFFLSDNGACAEWDPFGFDLKAPDPAATRPGMGVNLGTQAGPNVLHEGAALEHMGEANTFMSYGSGWANACNTPWRLYKHYGHEGGISTPLIVHWPAGIAAAEQGKLRSQPGHLIDLMTTCVDVATATYPQTREGHAILPMEGRSLVPALANQPVNRESLAWEHEGNRAIRVGDWKLVALKGRPWELYDMSRDRTELHNVASENPDRVKDLSAQWQTWAKRCNVLRADASGSPENKLK